MKTAAGAHWGQGDLEQGAHEIGADSDWQHARAALLLKAPQGVCQRPRGCLYQAAATAWNSTSAAAGASC